MNAFKVNNKVIIMMSVDLRTLRTKLPNTEVWSKSGLNFPIFRLITEILYCKSSYSG